ncbi:MAG: hypothetical protein AAF533_01110 [Acidobacteriota bacterium]
MLSSVGLTVAESRASELGSATHFIGERLGATCPEAEDSPFGRWVARELFPTEQVAADEELRETCHYRWVPRGEARPDTSALPDESGRPNLAWLAPDEPVVVPLAGRLDRSRLGWRSVGSPVLNPDDGAAEASVVLLRSQSAWFQDLVGATSDLAGLRFDDVRVAAIGDSPTGYLPGARAEIGGLASRGRGRHEESLGRLLRTLTCPGELQPGQPCVGHLSHHLALSLYRDSEGKLREDTVTGGHFGRRGDLALAIYDAVRTWRDELDRGGAEAQPHLVLLLAVGWSPIHGGEPGQGLDGPSLAVRRALEHAVRHGALVIAGAGNAEAGPHATSGPMFPGGWDRDEVALPDGRVASLLHAVGGVDQADRPLFNARVRGEPRLVAPGLLAIDRSMDASGRAEVEVDGRPSPTRVLTGSSVSTYVAGAAATLLKGLLPSLSNDEIMDLLHEQSIALGRQAAVGEGDVRRVSICSTLQAVEARRRCSSRAAGVGPLIAPNRSEVAELRERVAGPRANCREASAEGVFRPPVMGNCGAQVHVPWTSEATTTCPHPALTLPNAVAQPVLHPLPGVIPCIDCPIIVPETTSPGGTADLVIEIDPGYPETIDGPVLDLTCDNEIQHQIALGSLINGPLSAGDLRSITDLALPSGCTVESAEISWQVVGQFSSVTHALVVVVE